MATAVSWAVVQAVSSAVVDQQPAPLSRGAVSSELRSPAIGGTEAEASPSPSPPPAATPTSTPAGTQSGAPPPVAPTQAPRQSSAPPPSSSSTRTFTLVGGTAQLTCTNNQISLDYATPNPGYWVETGTSDGGSTIDIKFRSDSHESELQASCSGGQVQGSVQESSDG